MSTPSSWRVAWCDAPVRLSTSTRRRYDGTSKAPATASTRPADTTQTPARRPSLRRRPSGRSVRFLALDPGRMAGPFAFSQLKLLHLARRCAWKGVEELDPFGGLVVGKLV